MGVPNTSAARKGAVKLYATGYQISPKTLWGVYGTESGFGANLGPSSAGAVGPFQFLPSTARDRGVNANNFMSAAEGAAKYLHDLGADNDPESSATAAALNKYSGGGGSAYVSKVIENGKTYTGEGTDTITKRAGDTVVGGTVGAVTTGIDAVGDFFNLISEGSTWKKVMVVGGGGLLVVLGVLVLAGEFVQKVPTPIGALK